MSIVWRDENSGIVSQIQDALASGDPMFGNEGVVMSGMADQGTSFGEYVGGTWHFSSVGGGDGFGVAIGSSGYYWGSVPGSTRFACSGPTSVCSMDDGYHDMNPQLSQMDGPGGVRIVPVQTDPSGAIFLSTSQHNVWRTDM